MPRKTQRLQTSAIALSFANRSILWIGSATVRKTSLNLRLLR